MVAWLHEQPHTPDLQTGNWPACNEALRRRGSLTIWFDPEMIRDAAPTGKRGRQQTSGDIAIQTCLTMKGEGRPENSPVEGFQPRTGGAQGRFGMAPGQTTGFVKCLLRLIGLNWAVPDFRTPSRRQKTLAVTIPHRGCGGQKRGPASLEIPRPRNLAKPELLGQRLMARDFDRQVAEFQVRIAALNSYTALGIPVTDAVE